MDLARLRVARRVIASVVIFLALGVLAAVLVFAARPLRDRSLLLQPIELRPADVKLPLPSEQAGERQHLHWKDHLTGHEKDLGGVERACTVTIHKDAADVLVEFTLPAAHPWAWDATGGSVGDDPDGFLDAAWGHVEVDGHLVDRWERPVWTRDAARAEVRVMLHARRPVSSVTSVTLAPRPDSPLPARERIAVRVDEGVTLDRMQPEPDSADGRSATWTREHPERPEFLIVSATLPQLATTFVPTLDAGETPRRTTQQLLVQLANKVEVPLASQLLLALLLTLPLILFLRLAARAPASPTRYLEVFAEAVKAVLVFHFVLALVSGTETLLFRSRWTNWLVDGADVLANRFFAGHAFFKLVRLGFRLVEPAVVGVLVPGLLFAPPSTQPLSHRVVRGLGLGLGAAVPAASVTAVFVARGSLSLVYLQGMVLVAAVAFLLSWFGLQLLARQLDLWGKGSFALSLVTAVLIVLGSIDADNSAPSTWRYAVRLAVTLAIGVWLGTSLLRLVAHVLEAARPGATEWLGARRLIIVLLLLLLAVPIELDVAGATPLRPLQDVIYLGYALDYFIPFLFLAGVVWHLRATSSDTLEIGPFERALAILAVATLLFNPGANWCFVPITFLLGWTTLELLIRPSQSWERLAPLLAAVRGRASQIDRILDLNAAERGYNGLREKQREKLSAGEIDLDEYERKLDAERARLEALREQSMVGTMSMRDLALAFGPRPTAFGNALHGATYALVFATPWIGLSLHSLLGGTQLFGTSHPLLFLLRDVLAVVARWALVGFLLGYFYPYLPGRSGMHKAFALFWAIALPSLPQAAIYAAGVGEWRFILLFDLQMFIHCMLLGLVAFDYTTIQQGGRRDWRLLFQVHDLPSLGVSVSSVLVAIGATVTSLASAGGTALVTNVLRFLLPQLPAGTGGGGGAG